MIEVSGISKKYGLDYAAYNITFSARAGEPVGIFGARGAGKTTIADIISGCVYADSGSVIIDGYDIIKKPKKAKMKIGYCPEYPSLNNDMTVEEYLDFICRLRRVPKDRIRKTVEDTLDKAGVKEYADQLIGRLSGGLRQRTAIAAAFCGDTEVLIFDEPTENLDPDEAEDIRALIKSLSNDYTVVVLSHIVHDITEVCSDVIILSNGKISVKQHMESLLRSAGNQKRILVRLTADKKLALKKLNEIDGADYVDCLGCNEAGTCDFIIESLESDLRARVFETAVKSNMTLLAMSPMSVTLEDIFMQLTGSDGGRKT